MHAEFDDMVAWIDELRTRMASGALAGLGAVAIRGGMLDADLAARITLVDLAHETDLTRREMLLHDLERLREQIS